MTFIFVVVLYINQWDKQKQELHSGIDEAQYIEQTVSNMTTCTFEKWNPKYKQDSCVICYENFEADSQIWVTNEWDHIFHSEWLRNWYDRIKASKKLTWPHCWTENTPNSHPQESSELESVESCHIKMAYQHLMTEHGDNVIETSHLNASNHH